MSQRITPKPDTQVGGTHYSDLKIEPIQFIEANGLDYCEGNAVKYLSRWKSKNGLQDLEKAKWYVERLIQVETERIAVEQREELGDALTVHFGPGTPMPGESVSDELSEPLTCEQVDGDIMDLHFYGWQDMTTAARESVRMAALVAGVSIVDVLKEAAESSTGDVDSIKWTSQP